MNAPVRAPEKIRPKIGLLARLLILACVIAAVIGLTMRAAFIGPVALIQVVFVETVVALVVIAAVAW